MGCFSSAAYARGAVMQIITTLLAKSIIVDTRLAVPRRRKKKWGGSLKRCRRILTRTAKDMDVNLFKQIHKKCIHLREEPQ